MKKIKKILLVLLIVIVTGCSLSQSQLTTDYYTYINKDKIDEFGKGRNYKKCKMDGD